AAGTDRLVVVRGRDRVDSTRGPGQRGALDGSALATTTAEAAALRGQVDATTASRRIAGQHGAFRTRRAYVGTELRGLAELGHGRQVVHGFEAVPERQDALRLRRLRLLRNGLRLDLRGRPRRLGLDFFHHWLGEFRRRRRGLLQLLGLRDHGDHAFRQFLGRGGDLLRNVDEGEHDRNHQPDAQRDGQPLARTPVFFATRPQHEVRARTLRLEFALDDPLVPQAIEFLLMLEGFVLEQEELLVLLADLLHQVAAARIDIGDASAHGLGAAARTRNVPGP